MIVLYNALIELLLCLLSVVSPLEKVTQKIVVSVEVSLDSSVNTILGMTIYYNKARQKKLIHRSNSKVRRNNIWYL